MTSGRGSADAATKWRLKHRKRIEFAYEGFYGIPPQIPSEQWSQILWNGHLAQTHFIEFSWNFFDMSTSAFLMAIFGLHGVTKRTPHSKQYVYNSVKFIYYCAPQQLNLQLKASRGRVEK